jgi:hypothetical protein
MAGEHTAAISGPKDMRAPWLIFLFGALRPAFGLCLNDGMPTDATNTQLGFILRDAVRGSAPPYYPDCGCDVRDSGGPNYGIFTIRVCGKITTYAIQATGTVRQQCIGRLVGEDVLRFDCQCWRPAPQVCAYPRDAAGWLSIVVNMSAPCVLHKTCSTGGCA